MKRRNMIAALVLFAALGLGGYMIWDRQRGARVELVQVDQREIVEVYVSSGQLRARTNSELGSELSGQVAAVLVEAGMRRKRGDPLIELQPDDQKLALQRAQARVEIAERELQRQRAGASSAQKRVASAQIEAAQVELARAKRERSRTSELAKEGLSSPAQLDEARSAVRRAQANLQSAKAQRETLQPRAADLRVARAQLEETRANLEQVRSDLGKTTIRAPFNGLIQRVDASVGEQVGPRDNLLAMVRDEDLELYAELDEAYFPRLRPGLRASLRFPDQPGRSFPARLRRVGPEVDSARGVIGVHFTIEELPPGVLPGLSLDLRLDLRSLPDALALPRSAVRFVNDQAFVMVPEQGQARQRKVKIVAEGEDYLAIEGLSKDSQVLRDATVVEDGAPIRTKE